MTRLIVRVYLSISLGFLVTIIAVFGWLLRETPHDRAVVESALRGGFTLARERLLEASDGRRDAELEALTISFGYPVKVAPLESLALSPEDLERLQDGEPVLVDVHLVGQLDDRNALLMGPLPDFELDSSGIWWLAVVVLAWALVSFFVLQPVLRASRRLERAAKSMARGDLTTRIDPDRVALRDLAIAFNTMAERTEQLVTGQRSLIATVSHEFRTPLARIRFASERVPRIHDPAELRQVLAAVDDDVGALDDLVEELLDYTRLSIREPHARESFNLSSVLPGLATRIEAESIEIVVDDRTDGELLLQDARGFRHAAKNVIANAVRFAKSRVEISFEETQLGLVLTICDDGPGISPGNREAALEPFVQLGREGDHGGVGLGLAIVARVTTDVGGDISIGDSNLGGAKVTVSWPRA